MKTSDGNGIIYELKDCTIVIKEPTEDEHAGKLTIGIKYKHNEDWYGNYVEADANTEFAKLLTGLVGLQKLQEEVCGKPQARKCKATSNGYGRCSNCCAYCDDNKCNRRCKNDPEKCGQLEE